MASPLTVFPLRLLVKFRLDLEGSATESLVIRQDHGPTHVRLRAGETSPFLLGAEAPEFLKILWSNTGFYSRFSHTKRAGLSAEVG